MRTYIIKVETETDGITHYLIETEKLVDAKAKLLDRMIKVLLLGIGSTVKNDLEPLIKEIFMVEKTGGVWFYFDPDRPDTDSRVGKQIIKID